MLRLLGIICAITILSCQKPKEKDPEKYLLPPSNVSEYEGKYKEIKERLFDRFLSDGYVISRLNDTPYHLGDSLLWTGILLASLDCEEVEKSFNGLTRSLDEHDGFFVRFLPLPAEYVGGREVSWDGEVGAMFGWASLWRRCPSFHSQLREYWEKHKNSVENANELYPDTDARLVSGFRVPFDSISNKLGFNSNVSNIRMATLGFIMDRWTKLIVATKASCYRIHLMTITALTQDLIDRPIPSLWKNRFCNNTNGLGLELTDLYCNRSNFKEFFEEFEYNRWEYKHQRCRQWETPDSKEGLETPAIDYLILYKLAKEGIQ